MRKLSTAALLLGMGIASATTPMVAHAQTGPQCGGVNHCIDVAVTGGVIQPVVNVIVPGRNHQIYWRLVTPGYTFPQPPVDAIGWKPPSPINDNGKMPANEFACNRVTPTLFRCTDANSTRGTGVRTYQYGITVLDGGGKQVILDPWIINQ